MLLLASLVAACGTRGSAATGSGLKVVATTTLIGDVVKHVGGDRITLNTLLAPGVNGHSYEPTPQDVKLVADADVVFINGVGYEEFISGLVTNAGGDAQIVEVSKGIELLAFEGEGHAESTAEAEEAHAEGPHDPHVWFNPQNVKIWATNIEQKLSEIDAANAATYKANADTYRAQLDALDEWARQQVSQIPEANRKLVTDHDTFGYLAQHYGFELVGEVLPSISSAAEPSAQQVAEIEQVIRENNVPAVFVSNETSASLAEQVAQDTGAKLIFVYVESLSETGGEADTYEKFLRYDIAKIVEGLK